jgi:hypothetical protein
MSINFPADARLHIEAAIATHDVEGLSEGADALWDLALTEGTLPEPTFEFLLSVLAWNDFLEMIGSHTLLNYLEYMWELLAEQQKDQLLPVLESTYAKHRDPMSWFIISELLGQYYANSAALVTLRRLRRIEADGPRSLVPHGLEHLIQMSRGTQLAKDAYADLLEMQADSAPEIRKEVAISLQRLTFTKLFP